MALEHPIDHCDEAPARKRRSQPVRVIGREKMREGNGVRTVEFEIFDGNLFPGEVLRSEDVRRRDAPSSQNIAERAKVSEVCREVERRPVLRNAAAPGRLMP